MASAVRPKKKKSMESAQNRRSILPAGLALRRVVPAHLSDECNLPSLALAAAGDALRRAGLDPDEVLREPSYPTLLEEI